MTRLKKSKYNSRCSCSECSRSYAGFLFQTVRTARSHALNDRLRDLTRRREIGDAGLDIVNEMDNDTEMGTCTAETGIEDPEVVATLDDSHEIGLDAEMIPAIDIEFDDDELNYQIDETSDAIVDNSDDNDRDDGTGSERDEEETEIRHIETDIAPAVGQFMEAFLVLYQLTFTSRRGATVLLRFFNLILAAFGIAIQLPVTPSTVRRHIGFDHITDHVVRYVVCPQCHALYKRGESPESCSFVRFSNFTRHAQRQHCNTPLYTNGSTPRKEFPYNSLVANLKVFFNRPGFEQLINEWRDRNADLSGRMFDIYDGAMWTNIPDRDDNQLPFVAHRRSLLLTLNVDWFHPFQNSIYSCGAIYLVINNLPRSELFKKENVILVGVMPGPKEPKTEEMNNYLEPLVKELEMLYVGVPMTTYEHPDSTTTVRAALYMNACDIPAARKVSGFSAHNSTRACYKCERTFTAIPGTSQLDYSGFNFSAWIPTTAAKNQRDALQ